MRKNPEKTSPRKLVPTGDRTRARCVTSAHATTAVDLMHVEHCEISILQLIKKIIYLKIEDFCCGIGCVSFVFVLSCVVFGGGPGIVLTTHSGRPAQSRDCCSPYRRLTHGNLDCKSLGVSVRDWGRVNKRRRRRRRNELREAC